MRDKIIRQMEAVVLEVMRRNLSDFYNYDMPRIKDDPGFKFPAIWIVGELHAHLLELGNYKNSFFNEESVRFDYLRNPNPWDFFFTNNYYAKDKWFLITEKGIGPITRKQAEAAIMDYVKPAVYAWELENGPLHKLTKIPVKFRRITLDELKALIADCRAHGNDSLLQCFKNRQRSCRVATDQHIELIYQKRWNQFRFCEYINDKEVLAGAIVFHGWPETGYEMNGSVQIDPDYGWSSHT